MTFASMRWWALAAACLVALCARALAEPGQFVDIYLHDGRHFYGKIVEESADEITIEYYHGSIVMPMTFRAHQVREIVRHEKKEGTGDGDALPGDRSDEPDEGGWAVVPIEGTFGQELTAGFFEAAMRRAERDDAEAVVFHIDSPGGMVSELGRIRDELDRHDDREIVFYVDEEAFSAAALLCMSSEHFYVGPGARIGAAVAFRVESGAAEVDAKFTAAFAATWRAHAQRAGRAPAIVDAMIEMEKELWADTRTEPWTVYAEPPAGSGGADDDEGPFRCIDDRTHVLALDHIQALNIGVADGEAHRPRDVVAKLDLTAPDREAFDGEAFSDRYFRAYRTNMEKAKRAVEDFKAAAAMLEGAQNRAELRNRLREIMANLNRVVRLYERYDYVRNYIDGEGYSMDQFEELVRLIRRALGRE